MKKYDELYQEYPKVAKEYWEKRKVEHPTKRLLYNHLIKNDSMSDEAIAKRRETLERAYGLNTVVALIAFAAYVVCVLLSSKFMAVEILLSNRIVGIAVVIIAVAIIIVHEYTDAELKEILNNKYQKKLFVLTNWCNELESNGFDASSYRSVINSLQNEVDERYTPQFKGIFINSAANEKRMMNCQMLRKRDEPLLDQFVAFLTSIIRENFDDYTGTPENTEMVLKTYTFTPNVKYKDMPSYIKESYELACPVKKAEVQTNEQNQAGGQAVQGREESGCSTEP